MSFHKLVPESAPGCLKKGSPILGASLADVAPPVDQEGDLHVDLVVIYLAVLSHGGAAVEYLDSADVPDRLGCGSHRVANGVTE